jgi:hypothetical protein
MAGYRGHLACSTALGIAYGASAVWLFDFDWVPAAYAAIVTAASGLLPDLDSDSGVPVRALFGLASVLVPLLLLPRILGMNLPPEQSFAILIGSHVVVRYGLAAVFKRITVHRGMFHSIPAMLIAGLAVFLLYHQPEQLIRYYMAGGAMLGFLSHLVLDELFSVDLAGVKIRLKESAGSALKLMSSSWPANLATYALLLVLAFFAAMEFPGPREQWRQILQQTQILGWLGR